MANERQMKVLKRTMADGRVVLAPAHPFARIVVALAQEGKTNTQNALYYYSVPTVRILIIVVHER